MTCIAVQCPHRQSRQIVKRGKTARGIQRYLCQNTLCAQAIFLLDSVSTFETLSVRQRVKEYFGFL
jgi:transposase-like protein